MLRPLKDRIVVKPRERVKSTLIEVVSDEKENLGTVISTGPKAQGIEPGDTVRFGTGEGYLTYPQFIHKGERFLVMQEADVCFVEE